MYVASFIAAVFAIAFVACLSIILKLHRQGKDLRQEKEDMKKTLSSAEIQVAEMQALKDSLEKQLSELKDMFKKQENRIEDLRTALNSHSFDGRFPICSKCKDIRDEKGSWHTMEEFIASLSEAEFSHSLCPDCAKELYPDMFEDGKKLHTLTWK